LFFYFRAEMLGFMIIISLLFLLRGHIAHSLFIIVISLIILSPWTIRNYVVFGKIIPVTTSMGINFNYGHGEDNTHRVEEIRAGLKEDSTYEIKINEACYNLAIESIRKNPGAEFKESISKVISLWLFDKYRSKVKHPLYVVIWALSIFFFFIGFIKTYVNKESVSKLSFMNVYLIFSTILVIIFFNIPRYQIQMSYIMVPVMMYGLCEFAKIFKKKRKDNNLNFGKL
jgi:CDP-diglyceride synthetase